MIHVHFSVCLFAAFLLLTLPLNWILSAAVAALFHELCHVLALCALNVKITRIYVHARGCMIEASESQMWKQFICISAGPLGSFMLFFLYRNLPEIAISGFFQGLFNLVPVLPLDGGRLLQLVLFRFCPEHAESIMHYSALGICFLFYLIAFAVSIITSRGLWMLLPVFIMTAGLLPRKTPCKPEQIGVQ